MAQSVLQPNLGRVSVLKREVRLLRHGYEGIVLLFGIERTESDDQIARAISACRKEIA